MATNKNATIRYRALDKCFRDYRHRYYIENLIDKCEEELEYFNFTANVRRRQIFDDISFMESEAGWSIPLDRLRDGKKTYYRYYDRSFTINEQPLTDKEAQQLKTMIITFGPDLKVLSPEGYKQVILSKIKDNLQNYYMCRMTAHIICNFVLRNEEQKNIQYRYETNWL